MPDAATLGAEFLRWEVATAAAGCCSTSTRSTSPTFSRQKTPRACCSITIVTNASSRSPSRTGSANGARLTLTEPAVSAPLGGDACRLIPAGRSGQPTMSPCSRMFRPMIRNGRTRCSHFGAPSQRALAPRPRLATALAISIPPASFTKGARRTACSSSSPPMPKEICPSLENRIRLACWRWRKRSGISNRSIAPDGARCSCDFPQRDVELFRAVRTAATSA